jgi:hypothetical protein
MNTVDTVLAPGADVDLFDIHTELEERLLAAKGLADLLSIAINAKEKPSREMLADSADALDKLLGDVSTLFQALPMPKASPATPKAEPGRSAKSRTEA